MSSFAAVASRHEGAGACCGHSARRRCWGAMLHASGFLSEFRYVSDRFMLFVTLDDGRVSNFFTGAWMERWALQLAREVGTLGRFQSLQVFEHHPAMLGKVV